MFFEGLLCCLYLNNSFYFYYKSVLFAVLAKKPKLFYRAMVVSVNYETKMVLVRFDDFGYMDFVSFYRVRPLKSIQ